MLKMTLEEYVLNKLPENELESILDRYLNECIILDISEDDLDGIDYLCRYLQIIKDKQDERIKKCIERKG